MSRDLISIFQPAKNGTICKPNSLRKFQVNVVEALEDRQPPLIFSLHQTLPFLDVQVHLINNDIQTDLHTKPTDKHQYLLKTSCHPNHTKKAIPFGLFLRICSTDTFFDRRSRELIDYLTKRGYSRTSLQRDANRLRSIPRHATLQSQEQKSTKTDRTPFVTSFNPALPKISIVNKYTSLLQATANCKEAFPNPPVTDVTQAYVIY